MNEGWIKLYRKSKDNPLMRDYTAWGIFCWILLTVDRKTAEMTLGRFWASEYFKISPNTFYSALKRLEKKYKVITLSSNNRFTTVRVLNWAKYQDREQSSTQVINNTSTQPTTQASTHIQEVENKELRIETYTSLNYLLSIPSNDLAEFTIAFICTDRQVISKGQSLYDYCQSHGRRYKDYKAMLRNSLRKDFGDRIEAPHLTQDLPQEISEAGLARFAEMKEKILGKKLIN